MCRMGWSWWGSRIGLRQTRPLDSVRASPVGVNHAPTKGWWLADLVGQRLQFGLERPAERLDLRFLVHAAEIQGDAPEHALRPSVDDAFAVAVRRGRVKDRPLRRLARLDLGL